MKSAAIAKAFGIDIEKAAHGVYADNPENRRLNRVGQEYGHKKREEAPAGKSASQGKTNEGGIIAKQAQGASDKALKRAVEDPAAAPEVKAAAKKELENRGSGSEKEGKGDEKKGAKKASNALNESTFFLRNDAKFPSNLASAIQDIAKKNGVTFKDKGDYISLSVSFNDGFMYYTLSELYGVKMNKDGSLNHWRCLVQPNGAMHCYGPGYPDTAVHGQKPISEKEFLTNIKETIKRLSQYGK